MHVIFEKTIRQKECYSSMTSEDTQIGDEVEDMGENSENVEEGTEEEMVEGAEEEEGAEGAEETEETEGTEGVEGTDATAQDAPASNEEPQYVAPLPMEGGDIEEGTLEEGTLAGGKMPGKSKEPLLSHMSFLIGISVLTFLVGAFLGGLLARKKIKKGIEIYED